MISLLPTLFWPLIQPEQCRDVSAFLLLLSPQKVPFLMTLLRSPQLCWLESSPLPKGLLATRKYWQHYRHYRFFLYIFLWGIPITRVGVRSWYSLLVANNTWQQSHYWWSKALQFLRICRYATFQTPLRFHRLHLHLLWQVWNFQLRLNLIYWEIRPEHHRVL